MDYKEKIIVLLNDKELSQEQKEKLEEVFPELKESEDERIRKILIDYFDDANKSDENPLQSYGIHTDEVIAWLEKQGNEPKASYTTIVETGDGGINALVTRELPISGCDDSNYCSDCTNNKGCINCENGDMKETEHKTEPKFHKGEWIIFNGLTLYVEEVVRGFYRTVSIDGNYSSYDWNIDSSARLWTIKDAKDGDVLYAGGSHCYFKEYIFMFSSFTEDNVMSTHFGYDVFHGTFDKDITRFGREEDFMFVTPATKEQRDALMKAMADAGYTFDFEKKELKKIEQKPVYITDEWIEDYWQHEVVERELERCKHEFETLGGEQEGNSDKTANELHESFVPVDEEEQPKKKRPKILSMFYALLMCLFYVAVAIGTNILSHKLFGLQCGIDSIAFFMVFSIIWVLCYIHISED